MQKWEYYSVTLKRIPTERPLLGLKQWGYEQWSHYDFEAQEWVSGLEWWLHQQRELGEAGWRHVSDQFSAGMMVQAVAAHYEEVLGDRPSAVRGDTGKVE